MGNSTSVVYGFDLLEEYETLFASAEVRPAMKDAAHAAARKVLDARPRYLALTHLTGIPWFVIGALHSLESSCRFDRHLHNGDPLAQRTSRVPKNRPLTPPPFSWEQSAADALALVGLSAWDDWSVGGCLFKLEAYNGFGYRLHHADVSSPYLWSFTNHYTRGKYGADGRFDPKLVSKQVGVVALLRALEALLGESLWAGNQGVVRDLGPVAPLPYPGRTIRRGETSRRVVLAIQRALVARNCGPLVIDGDFGPDTEDSVRLFQARSVNRSGVPLGVDGRVGPITWEALFGEESVTTTLVHEQEEPLVAAALQAAETQIGVREEPPFKNTGAEVEAYLKSVGLGRGNAWCAAFVYWCFERAAEALGAANPLFKTGHCMTHWAEAGKRGVRRITAAQALEDPSVLMPGHVFIISYGGGKGHTGFVLNVQGGLLETIEGNTNGAGSREGDGVYLKRQRRIRDINVGFIDYAGLTFATRPEAPPSRPIEARPGTTTLVDVGELDPGATSGGLLRKAVEENAYEEPIWKDVAFDGLTVSVGAHALRAQVGGRLLRLPVSYLDVIAICNELDWIPATAELSDAIWSAATVHIGHVSMGDRSTPAASKIADQKMTRLDFTIGMNARMDARIPEDRFGELAGTEGKEWILSRRNLLPPRGRSAPQRGAANYGWHQLPHGEPVQPLGPDSVGCWHDDRHFDYSQTLRPIKRMARRADGTEVSLLDELERRGLPAAVLAPFRVAPRGLADGGDGRGLAASSGRGKGSPASGEGSPASSKGSKKRRSAV